MVTLVIKLSDRSNCTPIKLPRPKSSQKSSVTFVNPCRSPTNRSKLLNEKLNEKQEVRSKSSTTSKSKKVTPVIEEQKFIPYPEVKEPTKSQKERRRCELLADKRKKIAEGFYQSRSDEDDTLQVIESLNMEYSEKSAKKMREKSSRRIKKLLENEDVRVPRVLRFEDDKSDDYQKSQSNQKSRKKLNGFDDCEPGRNSAKIGSSMLCDNSATALNGGTLKMTKTHEL
ncbi:hypothetical protein DICVIV_13085 [Dictyocaulus viviparus]|uniref:Uncharacterized protein n=1 Tax=Dictyocaulus viviparus TaxID=29172 RepID=A0A0D8XET3_DICVI|nr:hypothetical protein DICVIV_13085 [Dictyocaulus viviparus]